MATMLSDEDHKRKAEEYRKKAEECRAKADAILDLRDELLESERVGDTRLSGLFHEARTTPLGSWRAATAFIRIEDGVARVEKVLKLQEGRWSPETHHGYDVLLNMSIKPFMDSDYFRDVIGDKLREDARMISASVENFEESANTHEHLAER